ncbi:hypothetical protein SERLA73DRAFT_139385 [Serpula lacrymans var. lacrymans S7.3]|uniref:Uncharacterized protein n=1 Tax=Serpula lacrymans var. lacrymans (strain S7.3) TaxID=936435 RepID=F8Q240_SERL3|nr:hypothetical protein SERLA73DRAFT_139385 [Serpula lacrymans var. lacrymans S7.3]
MGEQPTLMRPLSNRLLGTTSTGANPNGSERGAIDTQKASAKGSKDAQGGTGGEYAAGLSKEQIQPELSKSGVYATYRVSTFATLERPSIALAAAAAASTTSTSGCSFATDDIHGRGDGESKKGEVEDEEQAVDASEHGDLILVWRERL